MRHSLSTMGAAGMNIVLHKGHNIIFPERFHHLHVTLTVQKVEVARVNTLPKSLRLFGKILDRFLSLVNKRSTVCLELVVAHSEQLSHELVKEGIDAGLEVLRVTL